MSTVSNIWVSDVQTKIYSKVKAILTSKLKSKYPDIFITDDDETPSDPKFPTIYLNFLQPTERGMDLEGKTINAIYLTVEVEVTVTKAQGMTVCKEVSYAVMDVFKSMLFDAKMPNFNNDGSGTKTMFARYSRVIGYDDVI